MKIIKTILIILLFSVIINGFFRYKISPKTQDKQPAQTINNLEENIIETIEQSNESVVSIIITKDLQFYLQDPFNFRGQGSIVTQKQAKVGGGSGILISKKGYIITNKHVVEDPTAQYSVVFKDGSTANVEKIRLDEQIDIAIIKISTEKKSDLKPAKIISIDQNIKVGQFALAIGNALAEYENTVTLGIVSGRNRSIDQQNANLYVGLIQTDTPINAGNSGGPLINLNGEVIGINTAIAIGNSIGFAIPITKEFIESTLIQIEKYGQIKRPFIGIGNGILTKEGLLVQDVILGSPAEKSGIQSGDKINEINGKIINTEFPLLYQILTFNPGDQINLKVIKSDKTENILLKLE